MKKLYIAIILAALFIAGYLIGQSWQGNQELANQANQDMQQSAALSQHTQDQINR